MATATAEVTVRATIDLTCAGIGVDDLVEEIGSLHLQLADARKAAAMADDLASEAIDAVIKAGQHIDRLATQLASEYLRNEELAQRLAWARRVYITDRAELNAKREALRADSPFNGES